MKYDPVSTSLKMTYVSGMIYEYNDVPEDVYKAMKIAGSKGRYLNYNIKGKYAFNKIGTQAEVNT